MTVRALGRKACARNKSAIRLKESPETWSANYTISSYQQRRDIACSNTRRLEKQSEPISNSPIWFSTSQLVRCFHVPSSLRLSFLTKTTLLPDVCMYSGPFMLGLLEPLRSCGRAAALAAPTARLSSTGDVDCISESAIICLVWEKYAEGWFEVEAGTYRTETPLRPFAAARGFKSVPSGRRSNSWCSMAFLHGDRADGTRNWPSRNSAAQTSKSRNGVYRRKRGRR